ncbi:hypothetical protein GJAV_G00205330 [Gymnothorax javanicus]|nr:hypothetical protein GJAV_G00205330 [Gymnothorax javanicus]
MKNFSRLRYLVTCDQCFSHAGYVQALAFTNIWTNLCKWCDYTVPVCEGRVCYSNCSLNSFCLLSEEICVAVWKRDNDSTSVRTLCHNPKLPLENVLLANFSSPRCVMTRLPSEDGQLFVCGCVEEPECNDKLIFDKDLDSDEPDRLGSKDVIPVVVISLLPPLLVAVFATLGFYLYRTRRPSKQPKDWAPKRTPYHSLEAPEGRGTGGMPRSEYCRKIQSARDDAGSEASSARANCLNHNTELLPIQLEALVGKGRFAEVWRARLNHSTSGQYETVAVKIFPAVEYASWRNERAIFSDANLRHENVVQFLTAEERGGGAGHVESAVPAPRQYWLIMAYHGLGNLQDFLTGHVLSWAELCAMASSVARGLAHLHSDSAPCGTPKVPVAHRDLKSSNIVVKSWGECALCDFGLALRLDLSLTVDDFANSGQVGTARYMAPEVLESRVNLEDLEAFKQMDVYSMALVLWEMASRCDVIGEVKSYEPAFGSKVCEQPCVESMRDLVLRDRGRPDIPDNWVTHQGMKALCATITECWDHDPEARLTALCVVERLKTLEQESRLEPPVTDSDQSGILTPPTPPTPSPDPPSESPSLFPEVDTHSRLVTSV